jgi:UDP-N-acetylmuramyl pentapeptide synthase
MKSFIKKLVIATLTVEARVTLWAHRPRIVGITGSVGKTSTKDAVACVARRLGTTRESTKSYNSEFGISLTVLGLETAWGSFGGWFSNIIRGLGTALFSFSYPQWLVLEMGVDHPNDMRTAVALVQLDTAIITHIGDTPVHVEFFESVQDVVREKARIIQGLTPNGTLILSYDDEQVRTLKDESKHATLTFGSGEGADVRGDYYTVLYDEQGKPTGITFKMMHNGNIVPLTLAGVLGKQRMYPSLAAVAFGVTHGLNLVDIGDALSGRVFSPGRMRILEGMHKTTLIDDTYNASPIAVHEALAALKDLTGGRKIAVLGDMAGLGKHSISAHEMVGKECVGIDVLVTVGNRMRRAAEIAKENSVSRVESFEHARDAGLFVKSILKEGDVVLLKGSQSVRVERATKELLAHPDQAEQLLVRQGKEWEKR